MSYAEQKSWEDDLWAAGWERSGGSGWWVHPHVGGLHNFASAVAILRSWIV